MKIGAKVTFFNAKMRERRKELGLTQKELGEMCGVSSVTISKLEILELRAPTAKTKRLLFSVADALDCDVEYIFPEDYITAMELRKELGGISPWSGHSLIFIREVSLDRLSLGGEISGLLMPSAEDEACENIMDETLRENITKALEILSARERRVVGLIWGIDGDKPKTFAEVGAMMGVTKERIRQLEGQAFRRLRYPPRSRELRRLLK